MRPGKRDWPSIDIGAAEVKFTLLEVHLSVVQGREHVSPTSEELQQGSTTVAFEYTLSLTTSATCTRRSQRNSSAYRDS